MFETVAECCKSIEYGTLLLLALLLLAAIIVLLNKVNLQYPIAINADDGAN